MHGQQGRGTTRSRILDAALACFSTKGFDGTTIIEIERASGLSPGSGAFYRHFPSKEAVLHAVLEREMNRATLEQRDRELLGDHLDAHAALVRNYQRVLDGFGELAPLIDLLVRERDRLGDLVDSIRSIMLEGAVGTDTMLVGRINPSESSDPSDQEIATVAFAALIGLHLTRQFFGSLPFGMAPERFAEILATLVEATRDP